MASTEGSLEIKAARERLVAVKKLSSLAAKAYTEAKGTYNESKHEVKEAQKCLKEAEER